MLAVEKTRLQQAEGDRFLQKSIQRALSFLEKELAQLTKQIEVGLAASESWKAQEALLLSAPGIGHGLDGLGDKSQGGNAGSGFLPCKVMEQFVGHLKRAAFPIDELEGLRDLVAHRVAGELVGNERVAAARG